MTLDKLMVVGNQEIGELEPPAIPDDWDYSKSVVKATRLLTSWKSLTLDMVQELYIAREILSSQGARTDLGTIVPKWNDYCEAIGVEKRTANRWLNRFYPSQAALEPAEEIPLPAGRFNVVYADPPWQFDNSGMEESAKSHYPTLSTDELCVMPVHDFCVPETVLFMWATNAMLKDALEVVYAWGFSYKTNIAWVKNKGPSIGWFVKSRHELLLVATCEANTHPNEKPQSWFEASVSKHSRKPALVYELIESMYDGPYLELFARNPEQRNDWSFWGNEVPESQAS